MLVRHLPMDQKQGVDRKTLEIALYQLSNQLRWMDQKLIMKVENTITNQYYDRLNELSLLKKRLVNQHEEWSNNG